MDKYLEAEKELAEAQGWKDLREVPMYSPCKWLEGTRPDGTKGYPFPDYGRDDALAFRLMVDHGAEPYLMGEHSVRVAIFGSHVISVEDYADHPDKATAVRYAIVMAVIAKLKS